MAQPPTPAPPPGGRNDRPQAIWINLAETKSEYSQYRCSFEIKNKDGLRPGRYIAWLKWREDWAKWTGALRLDAREEWDKALEQSNTRPQPPTDSKDIPF